MATRLVALLRGINVGRNKRVGMSQLRDLLTDLSYTEVKTFLQSGNAIFTCSAAAETVSKDIEKALAEKLSVESKVIVRTAAELHAAVTADPLREVATDSSKYLVGFLAGDPDPGAVCAISALDVAPDEIRLIGRHVYLWYQDGVIASRLSQAGWEKSLGVPVTARNWNTVTKLAAMVAQ